MVVKIKVYEKGMLTMEHAYMASIEGVIQYHEKNILQVLEEKGVLEKARTLKKYIKDVKEWYEGKISEKVYVGLGYRASLEITLSNGKRIFYRLRSPINLDKLIDEISIMYKWCRNNYRCRQTRNKSKMFRAKNRLY